MRIEHGGGGEKTRFVCGFLSCDERLCGPMLETLPRILRVPLGDGPATAWLTSLLHAGTRETSAPRPGGETVLAKLSELLFVEALRRYIELLPEQQTGWLAGLRDRYVGRALALMHEDPGRDWTVQDLAGRVGMSRSSLAQRFTDFIGQPPMQYLARWRLTIAAQRLRNEKTSPGAPRGGQRLRFGSGVQPGIQACAGHDAGGVAPVRRKLKAKGVRREA